MGKTAFGGQSRSILSFLQFFAVHETEAWLLQLARPFFEKKFGKQIEAKATHPETVNFDEPPAKLLDQLLYEQVQAAL